MKFRELYEAKKTSEFEAEFIAARKAHPGSGYTPTFIDKVTSLIDGSVKQIHFAEFKAATNPKNDWGQPWIESLINKGLLKKVKEGRKLFIALADGVDTDKAIDTVVSVEHIDQFKNNPTRALQFVMSQKPVMRIDELEPTIARSGPASVKYAVNVVKGRWPQGEKAILKNPSAIIDYVAKVLKERWPEAETTFIKEVAKEPRGNDGDHYGWTSRALQYSKSMKLGRWKEIEPSLIAQSNVAADKSHFSTSQATYYVENYIRDTLDQRWPEFEEKCKNLIDFFAYIRWMNDKGISVPNKIFDGKKDEFLPFILKQIKKSGGSYSMKANKRMIDDLKRHVKWPELDTIGNSVDKFISAEKGG